jgi:hypothetical protein
VTDGAFGTEGGMTLETYAEVGVALFGKEPAERDAILSRYGLTSSGLDAAVTAWTARFQRDPAAALAYNDLYQRAMVAAGVQRPEVPIETYAQMLAEISSSGGDVAAVCARHGMDVQQFALLSQHWGQQVMRNPLLAQRFAAIMMESGAMTPHAVPPPAIPPGGATII